MGRLVGADFVARAVAVPAPAALAVAPPLFGLGAAHLAAEDAESTGGERVAERADGVVLRASAHVQLGEEAVVAGERVPRRADAGKLGGSLLELTAADQLAGAKEAGGTVLRAAAQETAREHLEAAGPWTAREETFEALERPPRAPRATARRQTRSA